MKDKSSIIKIAQKLTAKGQIDGAIAEWEKLLSGNRDATIHNTIGDLQLRKGAQNEAMDSFVKAAEIFKEDGFFPKAIAIYKKILNAVPSEVHALTALGELNEEQGLMSNAAEHYRKAAETYFRNNEFHKAIGIYEKIAKIIPADMVAKVKIAELHVKLDLNEKAADCYAAVAAEYFEKKDTERANVFYNKALEVAPENASSLLGLSMLAEDSDNLNKAFDLVSKAMSLAPGNADILAGFVRISQKAGKVDESKNTLNNLISEDPSNMDAKRFLGYMFLKEKDTDRAWEYLSSCIEEAINNEKYPEATNMLNHFLDIYPVDVKQRLIKIYRAQNENDSLLKELKELAALYEDDGKRNEALELYREGQKLNPQDTELFESINDLEQALGISKPDENVSTLEEDRGAIPHAANEEQVPEADLPSGQDFDVEATTSNEELHSIATDNSESNNQAAQSVPGSNVHDISEMVERNELPDNTVSPPSPPDESISPSNEPLPKEEGDAESFYANGVELKEAGQFDKAIEEFQKAAMDPERSMLSTRMIAACHMQQGAYPRAIAEFNKIIASLSPEDAGYINTKYELASAHENNSDFNKALELFEEIQAQEPGFRDVDQKISELKAQTEKIVAATPTPNQKPKKERISYI
jgi:tetratricopeptide (TPR) repeat protein